LVKWEPNLARSKNKYAGGFYLPDNENVDTWDFGLRILTKAKKMGVRVSNNCEF